jgi:hypothetical protein
MTTTLVWKTIDIAPAYEVSSAGQVRRRLPSKTGGLNVGDELKQSRHLFGYPTVTLISPNGKRLSVSLHVTVCTAFHGPKPTPQHQVGHLNGVPTDNRAENLKWVTPAENASHRYAHGTIKWGEESPVAKLTREQALEIREARLCRRKDYIAYAEKFGVNPQTIARLSRGETWRNLPLTRHDVVRTIGVKK